MIVAQPFTPRELAKEAFMAWKESLRDDQWQRLRQLLRKYSGMECPDNRREDLVQATALAARYAGDINTTALIERLDEPGQDALRSVWISAFTIHETYFFRDGPQLNAIRQIVLPERIAARRQERTLKIWSAGCSTGDEAYTLAIMLDQMLPDAELWNIRILGTDISGDVVQKARKGLYREWAFRQTPMHIRDEYFQPAGTNQWRVSEKLTKCVRFEHLNLKTGAYPSIMTGLYDLDLILCRNVLIYFTREDMDATIARMADCLAPGGFLALGPAEPTPAAGLPLELAPSSSSSLYRHKPGTQSKTSIWSSVTTTSIDANASSLARPSINELLSAASRGLNQPKQDDKQTEMQSSSSPISSKAQVPRPEIKSRPEPIVEKSEKIGLAKIKSLAEVGEWDELIRRSAELLPTDPLNAELQYFLALAFKETGRLTEAKESLRKCLFINNRHWMAHLVLAGVWQRESQSDRAKSHLSAILKGLEFKDPAEILPESDGVSVGRMRALADSQLKHLEGRN